MLYRRARPIQLAFEKDLANKFKGSWKDCISSYHVTLPLFQVKLLKGCNL